MGRKIKKIQVTIHTTVRLSRYDLEGTQEDVLRHINQVFEDARVLYPIGELYLDWQPRQWEDGEDLYVYVRREETDEERDKRAETTKVIERQVEARERKVYQELQKKFGAR